jgi:transposase-like protein
MAKRKRRVFTDEFKADAVRLCQAGSRSIGQVAKDLDLGETALRAWVARAAEQEMPERGPAQTLTAAERDELGELRKRVKRLEMEREILKKAAVYSTGRSNRTPTNSTRGSPVDHQAARSDIDGTK